jgi:hypothetical protein
MLKRKLVQSASCVLLVTSSLQCCSASYYRSNGNNYNNNNDNYSSGSMYGSNYAMALDVCYDSVVAVSSMTIGCDSPYTFYYGNGAHRNSPVCEYGDKATLKVQFQVTDDLQDGDNEIYFTMAAYDDNKNLLTSTYPEPLCEDYVGSSCTNAGSYSFVYKMKFPTPNGGDRSNFVPEIQMAFSTKGDSGYNLGAVNIQCQTWDQDQPDYISWREPETAVEKFHDFVTNYGMLIGSGILISAFVLFVLYQSMSNGNNSINPDFVANILSSSSSKDIV